MPNAVYGLRFPNGTEIWPPDIWNGCDFQTADGRQKTVEIVGQALREMHLNVPEAMGRYRWLVREAYDIDDPFVLDGDLVLRPSNAGTQHP
jgi:hypothetical protein